jgi:hypothetical protein
MKKLFLLLLFVSAASFGQIKINPVYIGYPDKEATDLMVRVMPFETSATTCQLYYELKACYTSVNGEPVPENCTVLANGNLSLTEVEFEAWGQSNTYIEDLALSKLFLTRKTED